MKLIGTLASLARRLSLCAMLVALGLTSQDCRAQQIYFDDLFNPTFGDGYLRRVNADGTGLQTILPIGGGLRGIGVDDVNGTMYWCDVDNFAIRRANLDGSGQTDIITSGLQFPAVVKVDPAGGHIYWGDMLSEEIWRAELDGSNAVTLIPTAFHRGIALDLVNGKIYWSTSISMFRGQIRRANLDGTNQEIVVSTALPEFKPNSIALDVAGGKIYWTDYVVDVVERSNLDGSNIETLWSAGGNKNPGGIALDLTRGKIYWGQDDDVSVHIASIRRMNLDGSDPEVVVSGLGSVMDLGLVDQVCYADCNGDEALNLADFGCFQTKFALGDMYADCNGDLVLNLADFGCFQTQFAQGCP